MRQSEIWPIGIGNAETKKPRGEAVHERGNVAAAAQFAIAVAKRKFGKPGGKLH
jgi:hypothetical protein